MPRDTDPLPQPQRPLGERVKRPRPEQPEWVPLSHNPRIERNVRTGKWRTNLPVPKD